MKSRFLVLFFAAALAINAFAADTQHAVIDPADDEVPLKNWLVDFAKQPGKNIQTDGTPPPATTALPSSASHFIAVAPCRVVDTRNPVGPFGGPFFSAFQTRSYAIPAGPCAGIPIAAAYSLNFTIVNYDATVAGFVTAYPSGTARPYVSTLNFGNGVNAVANAAIVPASATGSIDVFVTGNTHLIIDVNGYFVQGVVTSLTAGPGLSANSTTGAVTMSLAPGSPAYIANQTTQQTASFNVSGSGTVAGAFNAGTLASSGNITSPKFHVAARSSLYQALPATVNFNSNGGTLLIMVAGSGFVSTPGLFSFTVKIDGTAIGASWAYASEANSHKTTVPLTLIHVPAAGTHTLLLENGTTGGSTVAMQSDSNDTFEVTIIELPF